MECAKDRTILAGMRCCRFFESLDEETLRLIRPSAHRIHQPRATIIFHEGEPCKGLYIVESGSVKLYKESADAKEHVLHVVMPGDCFGEAALFLGTGYPASAAAVKNSSLILLRRDEFLQLLRENPDVSLRLMASMAQWAHRLVSSIEALTLKDAGARFAAYLISMLPAGAGDGCEVELGMTKQILASHLGMTGETLSRLLARFDEEGLISVRGRTVRILSVQGLTDLSEFGSYNHSATIPAREAS